MRRYKFKFKHRGILQDAKYECRSTLMALEEFWGEHGYNCELVNIEIQVINDINQS